MDLRSNGAFWVLLAALVAWLALGCTASASPKGVAPFRPEIRDTFTFRDEHGTDLLISYLDTGGSGDAAIVLIHGFGASAYTWKDLIDPLAERYRVIAIDLKGFGESGKPDDGHYSVFDQSEIVDRLIKHLGLRSVVLGGHSMGGTIALALASERWDEEAYRIERLVIIGAPAFRQRLPLFIMALDLPIIGEAALHIIPPTFVVRMVLQAGYYDDDLIKAKDIEAYARGLASPGGRRALARTARALADLNESGHTFDFDKIRMPALLIWGKYDAVVPAGFAFALRDALPGPVTLHRLAECGHIPPTERPEEALRLILEFLGPQPKP